MLSTFFRIRHSGFNHRFQVLLYMRYWSITQQLHYLYLFIHPCSAVVFSWWGSDRTKGQKTTEGGSSVHDRCNTRQDKPRSSQSITANECRIPQFLGWGVGRENRILYLPLHFKNQLSAVCIIKHYALLISKSLFSQCVTAKLSTNVCNCTIKYLQPPV